ncbi:MAG TPA: hypothetical protein VH418_11940 [Solirubrobacteraceae bacterium]|jgi:hypothetical protein
MFNAGAFTIRPAQTADEPTLAWLAALSTRPAVARPALIGDIDGVPAAAISLVDGRVVADPFRPTSALCADLRLHRSGWRAAAGRDAARRRVRALVPFLV